MEFTNTNQTTIDGIKALIYGKSGAGKTFLASTLPDVVIISAERGLLSLRNFSIPAIRIDNVADLDMAFRWVTESQEANAFHSIYLDSITEIAEQVLAAGKATTKDPRQAYGALIDHMNTTIKGFRDLVGKNVFMTAKQGREGDGLVTAMMPGRQLGQQLPYLFDEVFRLGVEGTHQSGNQYRFLQTQPDFQYDAKDRSGALDAIEQPNLTNVINKIRAAG